MKIYFPTIALLTALAISSCATVKVESNPPGAEVGVVLSGESSVRELGTTPFEMDMDDHDNVWNEGPITLVVRKHGYISQHFIIPNIAHTDLNIHTNLLPDFPSNYSELNKVLQLAFKAERHIMQRQFEKAEKVAEELRQINPNITSIFEIEGTLAYIKNDMRGARHAWKRVIELQPNNYEALKMIHTVEKRLGFRGRKPIKKREYKAPKSAAKDLKTKNNEDATKPTATGPAKK